MGNVRNKLWKRSVSFFNISHLLNVVTKSCVTQRFKTKILIIASHAATRSIKQKIKEIKKIKLAEVFMRCDWCCKFLILTSCSLCRNMIYHRKVRLVVRKLIHPGCFLIYFIFYSNKISVMKNLRLFICKSFTSQSNKDVKSIKWGATNFGLCMAPRASEDSLSCQRLPWHGHIRKAHYCHF